MGENRVQLQDTAKILGLQGVEVIKTTYTTTEEATEVIIHIRPINYKKTCPYCKSAATIRNGVDGYRRIKHLKIADAQCMLVVPRQRLKCKECFGTYTYEYEFVKGKERYTRAYKTQIYRIAIGSTVLHSAELTETPYSTAERFFKEAVRHIAPLTVTAAQEHANQSAKLILGIDDFAIRKGHNYNTGIHDLRGESLLGIVKGRKLSELRTFMKANATIAGLKPHAIVMDLAKNYHTFAAEFFPDAIRVADRFHVNRYILDALNEIRRRVSKELAPQARLNLKRNKHLLNKRGDCLNYAEQEQLQTMLAYSHDLKAVYELKERLIDWYDLSFNYKTAQTGYQQWCAHGYALNIPEINNALKTFTNWQEEIVNYHRCRFTNGIVEGRNAKIKALQRRRFFLRNRTFYEALIFIECNFLISHSYSKLLCT